MLFFNLFSKSKQPQKLPFVTDIHCHIVPGVDDGSPNVETSIELLSQMADWGLERIFASPHATFDRFENTRQNIAEPFARLKAEAEKVQLPLTIEHHFEYRIDEFFLAQLEQNNLTILPQNYILVENSFSHEPWGIDGILFDITTANMRPILAHPERYHYYWRNKSKFDELAEKGVLFQINLLSLAGHYGKGEREMALYLLKNKKVAFVGTDVHHSRHIDSINRYLKSSDYRKDIKLFDNLRNDTL